MQKANPDLNLWVLALESCLNLAAYLSSPVPLQYYKKARYP